MNRFAAAFGLTVACTIFVPATSAVGARSISQADSIVLASAHPQPFVVTGAAGTETKIAVSITNQSGATRTVRLAVASDDPAIQQWVTVANTIVDVAAGSTISAEIRVVIPVEATATSHEVTIIAMVDGDPQPVSSLVLPITVSGNPEGALQIASVRTDPKEDSKLLIQVRNDGALSVSAVGEIRAGNAEAIKPVALSVVVGASASEVVVVDVGTSLKLPAPVSVALRYGRDVASWSGTLRPVSTPRPVARPTAALQPTVNNTSPKSTGIPIATVVLVLLVGAAVVWLIVELLASKRVSATPTRSPSVGVDNSQDFTEVAEALGVTLAPLVAAIEHLATAFTHSEVVSAIQEKTMSDSHAYLADAAYAYTSRQYDGVQALSEIEQAAAVVRDAYLRPELDVETQEAIEAQLVADDAHHRAALIDEVACGLGIPKAVLLEWMPDDVFDRTEIEAVVVDAVAIQRENRVLELQVAILKRALAHFARR